MKGKGAVNAGSFVKGSKRPYQGRPKGSVNKVSQDVRQMILAALDKAGGEAYLAARAKDNPAAFLALVGKTLPRDLNIDGQIAVSAAILERLGRAIART